MRAALWLLILFALAVALALFAGNNQGTVTLFWPPWRVDLSLNLVVLILLATFVLVYSVLRLLGVLLDLPGQARRWRRQQKERTLHAGLLDAFSHLLAGRYIRSRKAALGVLAQQRSLDDTPGEEPAPQLHALVHLLAAESAQALQDRAGRDEHLREALAYSAGRDTHQTRDGAQLQGARWALQDHDPQAALQWLRELPQGTARRTLALRMKLKAARQLGQTELALETARVLARHRAFSPSAGQSIVRGLATDLLNTAHDATQLQSLWRALEDGERAMPELAIHAAQRLQQLDAGDAEGHARARAVLQPVWQQYPQLDEHLKVRLVQTLQGSLQALDGTWLASIEAAQMHHPRDAQLQYLAGMACLQRQLWGKAQQLLTLATQQLQEPTLARQAWRALGELAEQRGDAAAAQQAWRRAAML